jgi:hypothetical protein
MVSSLSIVQEGADGQELTMFRLGARFTVSPDRSRSIWRASSAPRAVTPVFVFSDATQERRIPTRWNSFAVTGGIGWDVLITDHLVFRPILDLFLGYVAGDVRLAISFEMYSPGCGGTGRSWMDHVFSGIVK